MKKALKILFVTFLFTTASTAIWQFYESLPIRGSFETGPVSYPSIDKGALKAELSLCSLEELEDMYKAGLEVTQWQNLLGKVGSTVYSDVIRDFDHFYIKDRYPYDESFDEETQSSYFYHSHRPQEHGHFHVYFKDEDIMDQFHPTSIWDEEFRNTHLVAISMHPDGNPIGFFIPNQFITKDHWYSAEDTVKMADHFAINHPYPSWPSNQWVGQMLRLFRPQIKSVLQMRDDRIVQSENNMDTFVRNRKVDVVASVGISVGDQMEVLKELIDQKTSQ